MAKSFDVTRLAEVKAKIPTKQISPESQPQSITQTISQDESLNVMARRVSLCFKQGDYEMYKRKQHKQRLSFSSSHDDTSFLCSTTTSGSCQTPDMAVVSQVEQKVFANERLIHEYRERIQRQEAKIDALYAHLSKTNQEIQEMKYSRGALIENLCVVVKKAKAPALDLDDAPASWLSIVLKLAMFFGLVYHVMEGSPQFLAAAVFGWWMTESFSS